MQEGSALKPFAQIALMTHSQIHIWANRLVQLLGDGRRPKLQKATTISKVRKLKLNHYVGSSKSPESYKQDNARPSSKGHNNDLKILGARPEKNRGATSL